MSDPVLLLLLMGGFQSTVGTRGERVLELLQSLQEQGSWHYSRAIFEAGVAPIGGEPIVVATALDVMCGNSDLGCVDDARVRRLALELCNIFGLDAVANQQVNNEECSVELDCFDPVRKLGFELRGRDDDIGEAADEPTTTGLEERDLAWLTAHGYRIFVEDLATLRNLDDDEFTATLSCLAGFVDFLDEHSDGEEVDLGGLLFEREATWSWPVGALALPEGVDSFDAGHEQGIVAARPVEIRVECRGIPDFGPPIQAVFIRDEEQEAERVARCALTTSTRGAPSVLNFRAGPPGHGSLLRVRQRLAETELVHESEGTFTILLPGTFDLSRPFQVELVLPPGRYEFYGPARIGAAADRR